MAEKFDPYRKWLGIPPHEQPPNYYRLLGIGLFESDPDVISNAADRQMVHVRSFQSGKHSALSQQILNELAAARVCLLDPKKRAEYDEQLRQQLAVSGVGALGLVGPVPAPPSAPPPPRASAPLLPSEPPGPPLSVAPAVFVAKPVRPVAATYAARRRKNAWQGPAITVALLAVAAALIGLIVSSTSGTRQKPSKKPTPRATKRSPVPEPFMSQDSGASDQPSFHPRKKPKAPKAYPEARPRPSPGADDKPIDLSPPSHKTAEPNDPVGGIRLWGLPSASAPIAGSRSLNQLSAALYPVAQPQRTGQRPEQRHRSDADGAVASRP